jgi:Protein of unknown function (DUF1559)
MAEPLDTDQEDYNDQQTGPLREDRPTRAPTPQVRKRSTRFALIVVSATLVVIFGLCTVGTTRIRQAANRMKGSGQMSQMAWAIHNYNDSNGELPHNTYAPDGKPLLSWRVHLLPYVEEDVLYHQFHLDEPWDSPHNIRLMDRMPSTYARPQDRKGSRGIRTFYRGFSSPGAIFEFRPSHVQRAPLPFIGLYKDPRTMFSLTDIKDGTSNTIMVVEAGDSVEWTKPEDLDASPDKPFPKMGGLGWRNSFQVLMADGSVRSFKLDTPDDKLRAWVTHSGGEKVPLD